MQVMPYVIGWLIGLAIGTITAISFGVIVGKYKYRLYQRYINLYQITDPAELNEQLTKYGFMIECNCKPTLRNYYDAGMYGNRIIILHWLRLIPVHGEKVKPISYKTIHEKKDSFNNVFKSVHNRNKKQKDIREPYTNA
jgi:hypothetical protein